MSESRKNVVDILLVEDNPGDVRLLREALRDAPAPTNLQVAHDGEQAITFLKGGAAHELPDIIILDLNLPRKDGREVLAEIKADPRLRHIPIVILTTSKAEQDIRSTYDLHANCFITKGVDWEQACDIVKLIESFWLKTATLPPHDPPKRPKTLTH